MPKAPMYAKEDLVKVTTGDHEVLPAHVTKMYSCPACRKGHLECHSDYLIESMGGRSTETFGYLCTHCRALLIVDYYTEEAKQ